MYATEIEQKMANTTTLKDSIINVVEDAHTLLKHVHNWLDCLTNKNQLVYPLCSEVNQLLIDSRNTKDKDQWNKIWEDIYTLKATFSWLKMNHPKEIKYFKTCGHWCKHIWRCCNSSLMTSMHIGILYRWHDWLIQHLILQLSSPAKNTHNYDKRPLPLSLSWGLHLKKLAKGKQCKKHQSKH